MVGCLLVADSSGEGEKECQHLEGFHQGTASHSIKLVDMARTGAKFEVFLILVILVIRVIMVIMVIFNFR